MSEGTGVVSYLRVTAYAVSHIHQLCLVYSLLTTSTNSVASMSSFTLSLLTVVIAMVTFALLRFQEEDLFDAVATNSNSFVIVEVCKRDKVMRTIATNCGAAPPAVVLPLKDRKLSLANVASLNIRVCPPRPLRHLYSSNPLQKGSIVWTFEG